MSFQANHHRRSPNTAGVCARISFGYLQKATKNEKSDNVHHLNRSLFYCASHNIIYILKQWGQKPNEEFN